MIDRSRRYHGISLPSYVEGWGYEETVADVETDVTARLVRADGSVRPIGPVRIENYEGGNVCLPPDSIDDYLAGKAALDLDLTSRGTGEVVTVRLAVVSRRPADVAPFTPTEPPAP